MKVVLSHPTGNANARAAACALAEANLLSRFHTTIASFPGSMLDRLSSIKVLSEINRRRFDVALRPYTQTWPWREAGRLAASKLGFNKLTAHERGPVCIDAVYKSMDRKVAASLKQPSTLGVNAVYAYEDGAAFSFRRAKCLGFQRLYDLPTGYWRAAHRLLAIERERWPEWITTLTGFQDSNEKLARKDEELRLANRIFVASQFTAKTLEDFPGKLAPVEVIPYGFPPVGDAKSSIVPFGNRPLKLLFVGKLSQQKGIADLFEAVKALGNHIQLTVVGHKASDNCPALDAALAKHHWIPSLNHQGILQLMRGHDVLVFPSLFDGFGLVITEAMSQGTPVIATNRSAGPSLIDHGKNGWLVEAGSTRALQTAIEALLHRPEAIAEAGIQAIETARSRPWEVYKRELADAVEKHLYYSRL